MTEKLLNELVESEIKVSELTSMVQARDSHILSLELQVEFLKFELIKERNKSNISIGCQTDIQIDYIENYSQTIDRFLKDTVECQTDEEIKDMIEVKQFEEIDEKSTEKNEIIMDDKRNTVDAGKNIGNVPQVYVKLRDKMEQPVSFISAINFRSSLPVSEAKIRRSSLMASVKGENSQS
ncbi:hypothetical protein SteCoe_21681 [Stentor coeruleus]|uniref:Uncharacterized protein n=1 Tax=Stentor coeruleus TaxID=5963 RepID=A0A1R2BP33_9CILI|nr:hypothetical protein SteCoe_21681 [Stentor coeruleus]